jgi:hypothetical protein
MSRWQRDLRSGVFGMQLEVVFELFWALCAHCRADVRGASRQSVLATAVMRYRSLRSRVVQG